MVLVDKDIRVRVANNQLIVKGFNEGNLGLSFVRPNDGSRVRQ